MTQQEKTNWEQIDQKADAIINRIDEFGVNSEIFKELDKYFRHEDYDEED